MPGAQTQAVQSIPLKTELECAFELVRSGHIGLIEQLRESLKREGYSGRQIVGRTLLK